MLTSNSKTPLPMRPSPEADLKLPQAPEDAVLAALIGGRARTTRSALPDLPRRTGSMLDMAPLKGSQASVDLPAQRGP